MPQLLDLYEKHGIKSTFFVTGYIAQKFPQVVEIIVGRGHEIGSHGLTHRPEDSFDSLSYNKQVNYLRRSKGILEDLSGQEVISFRAPALRTNHDTARALVDAGFSHPVEHDPLFAELRVIDLRKTHRI